MPVTTTTNVAPNLFIPRKGFVNADYQPSDFMINFLALERWANSFSPPIGQNLFIPHKPDNRHPLTTSELDANWHAIEDWANNYVIPYLS